MLELPIRDVLQGDAVPSADQLAVALKALTDGRMALGHLQEYLSKDGKVPRDLVKNILYVTDAALKDVGKTLDVPIETDAEREDRNARLRAANQQIHALQAQIGQAVTAEAVQYALERLGRRIDAWWDRHGFGYISEMGFSKYGHCSMKLSGNLTSFRSSMSDTPVSDRLTRVQWIARLKERGFVLDESEPGHESVVDCDSNRELLVALITSTFPSAKVTGFSSHAQRSGVFCLRDISVFIYHLSDVYALDEPQQA